MCNCTEECDQTFQLKLCDILVHHNFLSPRLWINLLQSAVPVVCQPPETPASGGGLALCWHLSHIWDRFFRTHHNANAAFVGFVSYFRISIFVLRKSCWDKGSLGLTWWRSGRRAGSRAYPRSQRCGHDPFPDSHKVNAHHKQPSEEARTWETLFHGRTSFLGYFTYIEISTWEEPQAGWTSAV